MTVAQQMHTQNNPMQTGQTRQSTRRAQTSLAKADHYPDIALSFDQPGL